MSLLNILPLINYTTTLPHSDNPSHFKMSKKNFLLKKLNIKMVYKLLMYTEKIKMESAVEVYSRLSY